MKIYICWEEGKYFTSFEEAQDYYEENLAYTTFNSFLSEHYESEDIFNFNEAMRQLAIKGYKSSLASEVEDWIADCCDVVEIEAECKEV